jgi:hypothetical protein
MANSVDWTHGFKGQRKEKMSFGYFHVFYLLALRSDFSCGGCCVRTDDKVYNCNTAAITFIYLSIVSMISKLLNVSKYLKS